MGSVEILERKPIEPKVELIAGTQVHMPAVHCTQVQAENPLPTEECKLKLKSQLNLSQRFDDRTIQAVGRGVMVMCLH